MSSRNRKVLEAHLEVPDRWMAALGQVIGSATRSGRLPKDAKGWLDDRSPQNRRASDAPKEPPRPAAPAPKKDDQERVSPSSRTGRIIPATNRFRAQAQDDQKSEPEEPKAGRKPSAARDDFDEEEPTDPGEEFPQFPPAAPAAQKLDLLPSQIGGGSGDDEYRSPFDWKKIDPQGTADYDPVLGRHEPKAKKKGPLSLLKRRPKDGRKELDKALKSFDKKKRGGLLRRLVRGKDVSGGDRWDEEVSMRSRRKVTEAMRRNNSVWEQITREIDGNSRVSIRIPESFVRRSLREEGEGGGGTVTVTVPREDAEELLHSLMGALETEEPSLDDLEGDVGEDEFSDDMGAGPPGFSSDDGDGDDMGGEPDGDDDDDGPDDDDDSDDDDEVEEDAEPQYGRPNPRPGTALGEVRRRGRGRLLF